jgi:ABC-type branched-subunit amino acid transport system ATPase component
MNLHESSGATFVMIEHDVELIAHLSDRLICMDLGRVIADGDPPSVLHDDRGTSVGSARSGSRRRLRPSSTEVTV